MKFPELVAGRGGGARIIMFAGGGVRGLQVIFVLVRRGAIFAKFIINNLNIVQGVLPPSRFVHAVY